MLGPFATASRYIAIHQVSLLSHAATVVRRLRIDVHNDDDDNNDNAWQRGPLRPQRMGPITRKRKVILIKYHTAAVYITVFCKAMKVSRVHVQHVQEYDFLLPQPVHPTVHLGETLDHLHRYSTAIS